MEYEILIGEVYNIVDKCTEERIKRVVSQDVYDFIQEFADRRKDRYFNTIYTINEVDFKVRPCFDSEIINHAQSWKKYHQ